MKWRIEKLSDLEQLFAEGDVGDIVTMVDARTKVERRYVIESDLKNTLVFVETG